MDTELGYHQARSGREFRDVARRSTARKLEDDLGGPDETELVPGDAFDGRRVVPQVFDPTSEVTDLLPELRVLALNVRELFGQRPQTR
jgi:hypothetical protein